MLAKRTIYFDFDSAVISGDGTDIVSAHAKYLSDHSDARVRLEGNTDERGSPEYNIGLGMRRAQAVRQALLLQGASAAQITVVSYGAEHPVDPAHAEDAWKKNRRVDIVYLAPNGQPAAAAAAVSLPGTSSQRSSPCARSSLSRSSRCSPPAAPRFLRIRIRCRSG